MKTFNKVLCCIIVILLIAIAIRIIGAMGITPTDIACSWFGFISASIAFLVISYMALMWVLSQPEEPKVRYVSSIKKGKAHK